MENVVVITDVRRWWHVINNVQEKMRCNFTKVLNVLAVAVGLLSSVGAAAQSFKIDASSGKVYTKVCMNGAADDVCKEDFHMVSFYSGGNSALGTSKFGAIWKHDYLPFEMTCSSGGGGYLDLSSSNRIPPNSFRSQYINAISMTADGKPIVVIAESEYGESALNMSLPMGFRFTSYSVTLRPATAAETSAAGITIDEDAEITVYSESQRDENDELCFTDDGTSIGSTASPSEQTFSVTETDKATLGNNLYFFLFNENVTNVAVVIEDATFEFECVPFTVTLNNSTNQWDGYTTPFNTGRLNLGDIYAQWDEQGNDIRYGYALVGGWEYFPSTLSEAKRRNAAMHRGNAEPGTGSRVDSASFVKKDAYEMQGSLMFYDEKAMTNKLPTLEANTAGKIYTSYSKNNLKAGTYYIETPVAANFSGNDPLGKNIEGTDSASVPVGYRITGLGMHITTDSKIVDGFYIKTDVGEYLDYVEYTQDDIKYKSLTFNADNTTDHTVWHIDLSAHIYTKYNDDIIYLDNYSTYFNNTRYVLLKPFTEKELGNSFKDLNEYTIEDGMISTNYSVSGEEKEKYSVFKTSQTVKEKDYNNNGSSGYNYIYGAFLYLSTTSETTDMSLAKAAGINENNYGVNVDIYTNSSSETPLVSLSKKKNTTEFTVSDNNSMATVSTNADNYINVMIGGSDNANAIDFINNDAVKVVVSYPEETDLTKYYSSIRFDVQIEPLNPYISSVRVAANGKSTDLKIVGTTIEKDLSALELSDDATLAFTALHKQNYLDLTSYGGNAAKTGYSMYGLVKSENYKDGWNGELYSSATADEYVEASIMPTSQFRWNNLNSIASKATKVTSMPTAQFYTERLFSENAYTSDGGVIGEVKGSDTFYLVTDDKPAFNISLATSLRHQSYAYYAEEAFKPYINFTKIYDTTFHNDAVDSDPFYGASVLALKTDGTLCNGSSATFSLAEMNKAVTDAIADETVTYTDGKPSKLDRLLYFDASNMLAVKMKDGDDATTTDYGDMSTVRAALAKNAMVYIPSVSNVSVAEDNVVKRTTGGYEATANIVLTDKEPLFIPTSFTTTSGNSVEYVREFTTEADGRVGLNTFVLPMALPLTDGVYDGNLKLYTLKSENCLTTTETGEGTDYYDVDATFTPVTGSTTEANTPYLAVVQTAGTEDGKTFTIKLTDEVEIVKTGTPGTDGVAVAGGASTGSVDGASVNFMSYGTYSGAALPKDDGYFYFGKDKLYKSNNLADKYPNVLMYPFRVYYDFAASDATAKKLAALGVNFDGGEATGISDVATDGGNNGSSITVSTGKGTITVTALTDTDVAVYGVSGQCIDRRGMASGESRTIATGSGIYLVNGKKVIVK